MMRYLQANQYFIYFRNKRNQSLMKKIIPVAAGLILIAGFFIWYLLQNRMIKLADNWTNL